MANQQLLSLANEIGDLLDSILRSANVDLDGTDGRTLIKFDLAQFMMYLSASDGRIQWSEANEIRAYLGLDSTPEKINNWIRNKNIYSSEFEQTVPITMQTIVQADNILYDNGKRNFNQCGAEALIAVYKAAGEELIKSDSDVDDNEMKDYHIYISMLEKYMYENDKFKMNGVVTGITKDGLSVSAPMKSGVTAPKKR